MSKIQQDMTAGTPWKIILRFTIPIFWGNIFQLFYNMADTVIVGRFVGTKALAAVGSTGTIMGLIFGFLLGLTTGFTVLTAQKYGAGDIKAMRQTVGGAAILSVVVAFVLTILSLLIIKPLLRLMQTPTDIFDDACLYAVIICSGIAAQLLYNLLAGMLRAIGNSKIPLYFLIFSAGLNILLDVILIAGMGMGIAGAGFATIISQGVSGILCIIYIARKVPLLHLEKEDWHPNYHLMGIQLRLGMPMALQFSIMSIGTMMLQTALNMLGSTAVAAYVAASRIEQIATQLYAALGTTQATYSAQNMGAGDVIRLQEGFRASTIIAILYSVAAGGLMLLFGKYMVYLFVSGNVSELIGAVDIYLWCSVPMYIPLALIHIYRNGIQGMGYGIIPMSSGVAELIGRGVVSMIAAEEKSFVGVCLASPAAWLLSALILLWMYAYIMKRDMKRFGTIQHRSKELNAKNMRK